jgi:hypothetical protein
MPWYRHTLPVCERRRLRAADPHNSEIRNVERWFDGARVDSQAMRQTDPGRKFWDPITTVPLTLLTLASLAVAWLRG